MAKSITITPEALEVLKRGTFTECSAGAFMHAFRFAESDKALAWPLYDAANKALAAAGGKWNKAAKAHLFTRDPRAKLSVTLATGKAVNRQQTLQLFPTPPAVATRMVHLAEPSALCRVLEPSAGTGRIMDAILADGDPGHLVAIEKDPELAAALVEKYAHGPCRTVLCGDFLSYAPGKTMSFACILMNPPFERCADIEHITHALKFLRPCGRLVAICAAGPKQREAFCHQPEKYLVKPGGTCTPHPWVTMWETLPSKTFAKEGTNIETAMVLFIRPEE